MDDNNLNHLIAVNVLVPRVASESSRLSVCEAERDEAREREAKAAAAWHLALSERDVLVAAIETHRERVYRGGPLIEGHPDEFLYAALSGAVPTPPEEHETGGES